MSTYLICIGDQLTIDDLVENLTLEPTKVWKKGETGVLKTRINKNSGAKFLASGVEMADLDGQVQDCIDFLKDYSEQIRKIVSFPGVDQVGLDFGVELEDVIIPTNYLPPELLKEAGNLGVAIQLSHYPPPHNES